ncbi:thioredoxin family protein [Candidatus Woesebacteria bacterium]|nr:thioredoxin family protein [Candidatus Woesebacteria bacterium]
MSKNLLLAIFVLALVLGGSYLYRNNNTQVMSPSPTPNTMVKTESTPISKQYLSYTKEALENTKGNSRVLFFYASWCPTCIPANADFEKNISMLPSDVTVIRVNYNDPDTDAEEKALATKYSITYQHTYVQIDAEGKAVTKWNGGATKELLAKIK